MLRKVIITQALIDMARPIRVASKEAITLKSHTKNFELYARNCPVALALNEACGETFVVKYRNYLLCTFEAKSDKRVLVLAGDVSQKIRLFDEDGVMEPFEFEVSYE